MSVCISFTYLGVKWVMFALARELRATCWVQGLGAARVSGAGELRALAAQA